MIAFIGDHFAGYGVEPSCWVLPLDRSAYHEHFARRRDPERLPARAQRDGLLRIKIRRALDEHFQVCGVCKVWRKLNREGGGVAPCKVARLMQAVGLGGAVRGKPVRTTMSNKAAPCPLDRANWQFRAPAPNRLWVSDFTDVATLSGMVYAGS